MKRELWIHDYEVFKNLILFAYLNANTKEVKVFELSAHVNNSISHKRFIRQRVAGLIGFNNSGYDSHLLDYHMKTKVISPIKYWEFSQNVIKRSKNNYSPVVPQIDLFKLNHFDRFGVSLKTCELRMNFHTIADLPYRFDKVLTNKEMQKVRNYVVNDLEATKELYEISKPKLYLRSVLKKEYNVNCYNWSDTKIGEELLLRKYCEYTDLDIDDVRNLRTHRASIAFKDIIYDDISFVDKSLSELLTELKEVTVSGTKGSFKRVIDIDGLSYVLGTGGLHASKKGIWRTNDEWQISEADANSYYPASMIQRELFPEHLGKTFCEVLDKEFVTPRNTIYKPQLKDPKLHHATRKKIAAFSDASKLSSNSIYGLSGSPYSPIYDPKLTLSVTVNNQLLLLMFIDKLRIETTAEVLVANTDGILFRYKKDEAASVAKVIKWWEDLSRITMEETKYDSVFQRDANNFIWKQGNKVKCKGAYEVDKLVGSTPALNKDNSKKVVALAVREYFINNTPIEQTITEHDNIYDFCIGKKANKGWWFSIKAFPDRKDLKIKNTKTLRYYVSNKGGLIYKNHEDSRKNFLEAGLKGKENKGHYWKLRMFNKFKDKTMKEYNIDYTFYLREAQKLIDAIEKHTIQPAEKVGE